jgi:DNA helicase MCM8
VRACVRACALLTAGLYHRLSPEAAAILQDFYITLREKHKSIDSTPITTRQLEALIRLAEARAKIELREIVEQSDALDVVELMRESLYQTLEDQYGNVDFRRTTGVSNQSGMRSFIRALEKAVERKSHEGNSNYKQFSMQELQQIKERMALNVPNFREFIENLNTAGYIIKRANRLYEYIGAD